MAGVTKVLVCPDSFKGTVEAKEAGEAIIAGLPPEVRKIARNVPATDGGTGFLRAMEAGRKNLKIHSIPVRGPLGDAAPRVRGPYGIDYTNNFAVVEMAEIAGLPMVPEDRRNPMFTTTFGVGEVVAHIAKKEHVTAIYIGLGGSATNDAAIPMMQAMGILRVRIGSKWYDETSEPLLGGNLVDIDELAILEEARARYPRLVLVSDVLNPFVGPAGATAVYGPQKGATTQQIFSHLENGLHNIANLMEKKYPNKELRQMKGAGAAGGMGGGLTVIAGAEWKPGAETFVELCDLRRHFQWADVVITGEGSFDAQTCCGKTISMIQKLCLEYRKKLVVICGKCVEGAESALKDGTVLTLISHFPLNRCLFQAPKCLTDIVHLHHKEILSLSSSGALAVGCHCQSKL